MRLSFPRRCVVWCAVLGLSLTPLAPLTATVVTLKNGVKLEGTIGKVASLGGNPLQPNGSAGEVDVASIVLLDDNLRRIFVPSKQVAAVADSEANNLEKIEVEQRVPRSGRRIGVIGSIYRITPFDEFGRRIFSMEGPRGRMDLVQGITEITPNYTKVECLLGKDNYIWTMYVATSNIPRETLTKVLLQQIDAKNPDERLKVVRLYIQAERFRDARVELEAILEEFPELKDLEKQITALNQLNAGRLIREIDMRRDGGQHRLAHRLLSAFPEEGVAGETLLRVRGMIGEYDKVRENGERVLKLLKQHEDATTAENRALMKPALDEIRNYLNINTLDRMADYLRFADDDKMKPEQKLSLAVSGWLLGSGSATENAAVSGDLIQVRDAVQKYLTTKLEHEREAVLEQLESLEGSTPTYLAKIVASMRPPVISDGGQQETPGLYKISTPGLPGEGDIEYYLQLPPEYDPYRRYPCVVTLNGSATSPKQQIDWWAGSYNERAKARLGQASRNGYIVIAPVWATEHQRKYRYSAREHAAVLYSLRDALQRSSIDTDRVFLSGHSMGGDAAWDIGLAHPDLWAGVLPLVATADRYVSRYWPNGRRLPMYFVGGEMDAKRLTGNARDLDRYLTKVGYDVTVVEYKGRGHEHFQDEIQSIFDWMRFHRRNFFPREFETVSMRAWDNYFWWVELDDFPERSIVPPMAWPDPKAKPANTEARVLENNNIRVRTAAKRCTVWLAPEMVDFDERVTVTINSDRGSNVKPSAAVLLEDVRTRGDRQHPVWAKYTPSRRRGRSE